MCEACTEARKHPLSGRYDANCDGCAARYLARDPRFFAAAKQGAFTPAYRGALHQMLPKMTQAQAHAKVKEWVR